MSLLEWHWNSPFIMSMMGILFVTIITYPASTVSLLTDIILIIILPWTTTISTIFIITSPWQHVRITCHIFILRVVSSSVVVSSKFWTLSMTSDCLLTLLVFITWEMSVFELPDGVMIGGVLLIIAGNTGELKLKLKLKMYLFNSFQIQYNLKLNIQ